MPRNLSPSRSRARKNYKHGFSITSQIPFCAIPLRLDSYNKCQFGCQYCFASTRAGHGRDRPLQQFTPDLLDQRLQRVKKGIVASALDEFLVQRVPIQFGGMSDPFMSIESKLGNTRALLVLLRDHGYPFVISTKSPLVASIDYREILAGSNCYVRFSTTVISEDHRAKIDRGCPKFEEICQAAEVLSSSGIPVCFRFQPIIPGFESEAFKMLLLARESGVRHISAEFLKVPNEANKKFGRELKSILSGNPIDSYLRSGATKMDGEYVLPLSYRTPFLVDMYHSARAASMTFGFADNDLLIHGDGRSCCSGVDLYLKDAKHFSANVVGLAQTKSPGQKLYFSDFNNFWIPSSLISPYLNSKSRIQKRVDSEKEWWTYLSQIWRGDLGSYSPDFFDGIFATDELCELEMPVFVREVSEFERCLSVGLQDRAVS